MPKRSATRAKRKSQRTGVRGQGPDGRSGWTEFEMLRELRERDDRRRSRNRHQLLLPILTRPGKPGVNAARALVRDVTKQRDLRAAAAVSSTQPSARAVVKVRRARVPTLEELCRQERGRQAQRREVMFAKGSAGKGRRNTGPRQRSLLQELCK